MSPDPTTLTTISPITLRTLLTRPALQPTEIPSLLSRSTTAFSTFRHTHSLSARQSIVRKFLNLILTKKDVLGQELTDQMGRPIRYTAKEIETMVKRGEYLLKLSDEALSDVPGEAETGFKRWVSKEPLGVVLIIFAWNYPYLILVNALVPALLAGNVVIVKPSPQTPTVGERVKEAFEECGLPKDVIQVVHSGAPEVVAELIKRKEVAQVSFTGSKVGGLAVQRAVVDSGRLIPVTLELGGNDPAYVREDVDVGWAAEEIVDGAVFNSGQSCCAVERVYVHERVYEEFCEKVVEVVRGYKIGDPWESETQVGPVISVQAAKRIREDVQEAVAKGARDITPVEVFEKMIEEKGLPETFVRIYVLKDCPQDSRIMQTETFGPVIPILKVGSDEEAIRYMNDSDLGLTGSIWTRDVKRGEELAGLVEAGTVFVNRADYPSPDLVWNGWKDSGRGGTLGRSAFEGFVKPKSWHVKEYPGGN